MLGLMSVTPILHRSLLRSSAASRSSLLLASIVAGRLVGAATLCHVIPVFAQSRRARPVLFDPDGQLGLLRIELGPQGDQLRLERRAQPLEGPFLATELLLLHDHG